MSHTNPATRHEFVLLFDVTNGNPNGDPDAGNLPRIDPETNLGIVTDVCLKRKVRDYVSLVGGKDIFIQSRVALNALIAEEAEQKDKGKDKQEGKRPDPNIQTAMCKKYFDIRMFGAVLSTGKYNGGQVRGPVQMTFARSMDPVLPLDLSITRVAITREEDFGQKTTEMGRKPIVPYGLYRAHGYYNPFLGETTGVSEEDLALLWEALENLFEFDRSAARGEMTMRGLWIFTHENKKGNAPAHRLFEQIRIRRKAGVEAPRQFEDYEITPKEEVEEGLKDRGVTLTVVQ